ncbi:hypothetical protein Tco_0329101 [Tanacetum coccineum]
MCSPLPKIRTPATWLRPLPEEDRSKTPKPYRSIPPNDLPEPENNWANALATTYKDPEENKKRIFTKGRKTKPKTTKLGTEWKSVKRRSQIEAKKSIKSKSQQKSQTVKVKVNPDKVKVKRKSKSEEI